MHRPRLHRLNAWLRSEGYAHFLLAFLGVLIAIGPLSDRFLFHVPIRKLGLYALIGMTVVAVGRTRRRIFVAGVLAVPLVLGISGRTGPGIHLAAAVSGIAFFGVLMSFLVYDLLRTKEVGAGSISYALCAYIFIGVAFAFAYELVFALDPSSFPGLIVEEISDLTAEGHWTRIEAEEVLASQQSSELFYFSIVTLTTLGYGDITPASSWAETLAMLEALMGQILLVVLVARLVGLHIASGQTASRPSPEEARGGRRGHSPVHRD